MEALGSDYKGYVNDPETKKLLNVVLAGDSKFLFIGKKNISEKLNNVLQLLNNELAKYD